MIARLSRHIGFVTMAVAALALAPRHSDAQVAARLAPDSISGVANQQKTMALTASMGTTALGSYTVSIVWDSTVVRLDSVGKTAAFGTPTVRYVNGGEVFITQANGPPGMSGTFALANLYFRIVGAVEGQRTAVQTQFTEMTSAVDFTNLLPQLAAPGGVARVLTPRTTVGFTPDSTNQRVGYKPEIDLAVDLTSDPDVAIGSYVADVTWDPSIMLLDSVGAGSLGKPQTNQLGSGSIRLTGADAIGGAGKAVLARLYFRYVNATFPSLTTLSLTVTELRAALSFGDLLPGATVRNGKAVVGGWLRGDIDVSDAVTALDAATILNGVVGLPMSLPAGLTGLPQGDADCDGVLTAKDAQIVLNFVVGNVIPFCVGKIQ
jgi:hypothetical protein